MDVWVRLAYLVGGLREAQVQLRDGGTRHGAGVGHADRDGVEDVPERWVAAGGYGVVCGRGGDAAAAGHAGDCCGAHGEGGVGEAVAEFVLDAFVEVVEVACWSVSESLGVVRLGGGDER